MVELTTNGLELRSMALFHGHELRRPWFICCAHEVHAKGGEPKGALEVELGERRPPLVGALAVRNHHVEAVVVTWLRKVQPRGANAVVQRLLQTFEIS